MTKELPIELVEAILDYLHDDKRALKMCSLVCKAWLHPTYRLLFYDTRLSWYRFTTAFDRQSKSTAVPFIRRLHIGYGPPHLWNEILPFLSGFHLITSLTLDTLYWDKIFPRVQSIISNRFTTITRLELQSLFTATFSELAQMICTFRCLENLILGSIYWCRTDTASSVLRLPHRLHALELDGDDLTEILEWFCSFGQDLTLRNLCLLNPWQHDEQVINALLQVLGPSLDSFRIRLTDLALPICLHHNTHLRVLHIIVRRGLEREIGLALILSSVISVRIEEISLSLLHPLGHSDGIFHDCAPNEWGEVDAILARPQFLNLKSVSVRHAQDSLDSPDAEHPLEWFFDRLPLCHKRGILRLCETKTSGPFL